MDEIKNQNRVNAGKQAKSDGAFFERMIEDACFRYKIKGQAYIEKTPEPLKPIRKEGKRFLAVFEDKAQPDFKGTLKGGRAICFEAKATNDDKIHCARLQAQQIEALKCHRELGAMVFVLVMFLQENKCFKVPLDYWLNAKKMFNRSYFKLQELSRFLIPTEGMKIDFLVDCEEVKE